MTMAPASRIGPYEILSALGAGVPRATGESLGLSGFLPDGRHYVDGVTTSDPATTGTFVATLDETARSWLLYSAPEAAILRSSDAARAPRVAEPANAARAVRVEPLGVASRES